MTTDKDGNVAVVETNVSKIAFFSPDWSVSEVSLSPDAGLGGIATGVTGNTVWYAVTEGKLGRIAIGKRQEGPTYINDKRWRRDTHTTRVAAAFDMMQRSGLGRVERIGTA